MDLVPFQLKALERPRSIGNGLLHIGVDDFPRFGIGKNSFFKYSSIPLFPNIPHEESHEGFPCSI
jgi:hypothetical protein